MKGFLALFIGVAIVTAIIFRVPQIRGVVIGNGAPAA